MNKWLRITLFVGGGLALAAVLVGVGYVAFWVVVLNIGFHLFGF